MPDTIVNIHEAKTHLSRLIERVEAGETIIVAKAGRPKVRLVPVRSQAPRQPGRFKGELVVDEAFLAPLTEGDLRVWEGGGE